MIFSWSLVVFPQKDIIKGSHTGLILSFSSLLAVMKKCRFKAAFSIFG
jgi:hypothetical protein